jgi:bacterioferritin-associated ferredoxin
MIPKDKLICFCNNATVQDIIDTVKENNITHLDALREIESAPLGDKCESCLENGYENDGYSLACVLSLVQTGQLK